jgi:hypothetical protein
MDVDTNVSNMYINTWREIQTSFNRLFSYIMLFAGKVCNGTFGYNERFGYNETFGCFYPFFVT